jgi:hypothetical protein
MLQLAAVVALALAPDASAQSRATVDRVDDSIAAQLHVIYALPSDGVDRALDTDGTLERSVSSFESWLAGKTDGRRLRLDTFAGALDITFLRLSRTDAELASHGALVRDEIEQELDAAGFDAPNKVYAVYYDGTSNFSCGGGAWPPSLPGNVAALYLDGLPESPVPCRSNPFAGPGAPPGYLEFAMLHEIMHTLGFVATCAPNHHRAGHVSDNPDDLMWAGDGPWVPSGWGNVVLDAGGDDYYGHSNAGCLDLDDSPLLTAADVPTSPYSAEVHADAPRAYWRLGEASGPVAGDEMGAAPGTYQNGVALGVPGALADDGDTAARFDGVDDRVNMGDPASGSLDVGTGDFSVELWLKTSVRREQAAISKRGPGPYWQVTVTDDPGRVGRVRMNVSDGAVRRQVYGPTVRVDDGAWHHVVAVVDRDTAITVYVDGAAHATPGAFVGDIGNAAALLVGKSSGYPYFKGDLDEIALYATTLAPARIQAHHAAGRGA